MTDLAPAPTAGPDAGTGTDRLEQRLEEHRTSLTGYCYRMLGSVFDAEDAVQETMVRAWRAIDGFEGRSSLRSWLFRIAHRVCLDTIDGRGRRALPMDLSAEPSAPVAASLGVPRPRGTWVEPVLDVAVVPAQGDPAEVAVARESVRLAFVAALQHLPPRQRSVLVLREVLRWRADEVAQLLETSMASVNSALQRARATLAAHDVAAPSSAAAPLDERDKELLDRYVDAFERYDMAALVLLLAEDATQSMPPFSLWLRGRDDVIAWMVGPGAGCRGSRLLPVAVSGAPAFAHYKPDGAGFAPWAIHVLQLRDGRVAGTTSFLDTDLFAQFGLPARLEP